MRGEPYKLGCIVISPSAYQRSLGPNYSGGLAHNSEAAAAPVRGAIGGTMQCGWYKEVRVKDLDSHAVKALLVSRALLVKIKRDLENEIRGLLKNLGLIIGRQR